MQWYVSNIEEMVIQVCQKYGLKAERNKDTGVWINEKKIAAIGSFFSLFF